MNRKRKSGGIRLFVPIALLPTVSIISIMLLIMLFFSRNLFQVNIDHLIQNGEHLCRTISITSVDSLFNETYHELNLIVDEYSDEYIRSIKIANRAGVIVASTDKTVLNTRADTDIFPETAEEPLTDYSAVSEKIIIRNNIAYEGVDLGVIEIVLSTSATMHQYLQVMMKIGFLSLLILLIGLIAAFAGAHRISEPIERLTMSVEGFLEGREVNPSEESSFIEIQKLQSVYAGMLEKINSREEELKIARRDAERANSAKSIFMANISHELRTPLNGILGFSKMLGETSLDEQQRLYLMTIVNSGETLSAVIKNLLALVELDSGDYNLEQKQFDLEAILKKLDGITRLLIGKKHVDYSYNIDKNCRYIISDAERLEQILFLLLSNAVKFTDEGSIRLSVKWEDGLLIELQDSGIGIDESRYEDVFTSLSQVENPLTKKHRGIGAGLGIVKHLTELMDGRIRIESRLNSGTLVSVWLGLVRKGCLEEVVSCSSMDARSPVRILLVEDEAVNRLFLTMLLEKEGYEVRGVGDGQGCYRGL